MAARPGAGHSALHPGDKRVKIKVWIDNSYVVNTLKAIGNGWRPGTKAKHGERWDELIRRKKPGVLTRLLTA